MKTIKGKLIVGVSALTFLITLGVCTYYYCSTKAALKKEIIKSTETNLEYFLSNIDKLLGRCEALSDFIYINPTIDKVLIRDYENDSQMPYYALDRDLSEALHLLDTRITNDTIAGFIRGVVIKGRNGVVVRWGYDPDYYRIEEAEQKEWFQAGSVSHRTEWTGLQKNITFNERTPAYILPIVRAVIYTDGYKPIGWQMISVSPNIIKEALSDFHFSETSRVFICDGEGRCIYGTGENRQGEYLKVLTEGRSGSYLLDQNGTKWLKINRTSEYSGFTITELVNESVLTDQNHILLRTTGLMMVIIVILAFLMTMYLSNILTKPIKKISNKMKFVAGGDFSRDLALEVPGEMGDLGRGINDMAESIGRLMSQVRADEAKKQELEYRTLQSQINPHFVYNILNTIKIMATVQGAAGIVDMVTNFSELLKEVSKGVDDRVLISREFELLDHYLYIQKIRKQGLIKAEYEIEEDVQKCTILKFLLQPLMENSIVHGLEGIKGMGYLWIWACRKGEDVCISIRDNGRGISREEIDRIMNGGEIRKSGYNQVGIHNVQERIRLIYGEHYGVSISSSPGEYTEVKVLIPMEFEEDEKCVSGSNSR